ncbi:Atxe2 family lasso peptide isopeptidase [Luteimonas soli]|uniref:Atxe2 family lasso peptide isopeptidase n=1 Tax=Luteimonas soli TaxID=1648966 RepID=A0ABV7XMJ4_9GAMM
MELLSGPIMLACLLLASAGDAGAIPPRRLVEVTDISLPVVSPAGDRVAFRVERPSIERNTWDTAWYVERLDGEPLPVRVAEGGVPLRDSAGLPVPTAAVWSPDGRWIYYRALIDGKIDVWRAATDGSGAGPVTHDAADVREFRIEADGRSIAYSTGATREEVLAAEEGEYNRGIRIDAHTPTSQGLFRSGYTEGRLATQRLGFWFDRVPLLAGVPDHWHRLDLRSGEKRTLTGSEVPRSPIALDDLPETLGTPQRLAQDPESGRIAFLARNQDTEGSPASSAIRLAVLPDRHARTPVECVDPLCVGRPITTVQWRPGSDEVIFTVTDPDEGLAQSVFRWDIRSGAVHPVASATGLLSGGRDERSGCGVSGSRLVCVSAGADQPPRLERIDLATGQRHVIFDPNAALAQDLAVMHPQVMRWTDRNGLHFSGLYFPARRSGSRPPPLFVTYYKCPGFQRGGYGNEWPLASLAAHGIAALCINAVPYRPQAVERYSIGLSAVESAIDVLSKSGAIDPRKVGMGGLSFGTEVTMWTVIHSNLLSAASITSPLLSRTMYLHGSLKGEPFFSGLEATWQAGSPERTPAQWQTLAPAQNLDGIRAPILMQMPEQEYLWALDYAIPLIRRGMADVYAFPNEPHFKFQPKHLLAVNERNLDWFRFWLLGEEDPDPAKRAQYAQWRGMEQQPHGVAQSGP